MHWPEGRPRILAADVGGTHLSLALLEPRGSRLEILRRETFATQKEASFLAPCKRFLAACAPIQPDLACLSGAGPVQGQGIRLTNIPWDMDGSEVSRALGIPVRVINDFTAIAHGVLLMQETGTGRLLPIPHLEGSLPGVDPAGTVLVVGAGTGLGVGYIIRHGRSPLVLPSEGGHIGLPILDDETLALWRYLRPRYPGPPTAESAVSGPGIATIFEFLADSVGHGDSLAAVEILGMAPLARSAAISARAATDPLCRRTLELFVDLYARVCAELCAVLLPRGGLYLAGGIAAKNEGVFLAGDRFMRCFETNSRPHLDAITRATPVAIVQDYDISLYGAARVALEPGTGP
nr:glucokinase [uncultured Holophaga sp.]